MLVLILLPFLGYSERLRIFLMFHRDQKWATKSVKRMELTESLSIFDHDNEAARYIWGATNTISVIIRP
jgi:hypothetical protein